MAVDETVILLHPPPLPSGLSPTARRRACDERVRVRRHQVDVREVELREVLLDLR